MTLISVDLDRFPEHEAQLREHAEQWVHDGRTAQLEKSVWEAIRDGRTVSESHPPTNRRSRGLGDTIAKATKAVGIKPCGGCKRRAEKLNKLMPYKSQ